MRAKFEEFASVFFSALGLAFVALGILVVPADAFAAYNGECINCKNSSTRAQCASDCCSTFKDDLTARCQCCNDACGDDAECLKRCAEEACGGDLECQTSCAIQGQKKCIAGSVTCENLKEPTCWYNFSLKRCTQNGDSVAIGDVRYVIKDSCNVSAEPKNCALCSCQQMVVNGEKIRSCWCNTKP
jgi:hypothetical protein